MALYLLRSLTADECRLASIISRCLIAHVNSRDNSGVLAGSNGGSHMGGTHPCRWTGSTTILNKYYRTKSPVRYDIDMSVAMAPCQPLHLQVWTMLGVCRSGNQHDESPRHRLSTSNMLQCCSLCSEIGTSQLLLLHCRGTGPHCRERSHLVGWVVVWLGGEVGVCVGG